MSDPKMISPMLDDFIMGGAMSEHHGVSCYPAIENATGDRYIVKVISVPATPTQLDALLLTGAYPSRESALAYFKDIANGVLAEIDTLEKLTELEGFIAYNACQLEPMESGDGFDIYLLSTYKRTLQKHFKRHSFTHLDALNLGLDLCAALSVCRRLGYLYVDLKPSNVFVTDQRLFRIGDLGFMRLDSLKYASIPEKYISTYTPPEIRDAFSALNTTMDVYAAGLILYQTYNNGELPFNVDVHPGDQLPAPLYADYEMSEIILKACAANPEDRWQDPTQMGQAIISYMQRNGAVDTPIVPMPTQKTEAEQQLQEQADEVTPEVAEEDVAIIPCVDAAHSASTAIEVDDAEVDVLQAEAADEPVQEDFEEEIPSESEEETDTEITQESNSESTSTAIPIAFDEELGSEDDNCLEANEALADAQDAVLTEEVSEMLNQADDLASLDVPEPVIVPDHLDIPEPEPVVAESETTSDEAEADEESEMVDEDNSEIEDSVNITDDETDDALTSPPVKRHWMRNAIIAVVLLALLVGGFFFIKHYYLLPVELVSLDGNMDTLTVHIRTEIDESLLTVICSDTYGNKIPAPVIDGKAHFTGLVPNTAYTVKVTAKGFHRLTGNAKSAYSTPIQSNVVQFDAVTGTTDDSAILSFTVEGPNIDNWSVLYFAEGEEEKTASFTSHMVTITGLSVGKEYTFRLIPDGDLYVAGQSEITFTPRRLITAQNLRATSCVNSTLSVAWDAPEDDVVTNWSVHCFNDTYNKTIITTETTASFADLDHTAGYTIEVKAAGMSVGQSATVPPNSITAENFTIDSSDPTKLVFSWVMNESIPESGWLLHYSVVGIDNVETVPCSTNTVTIAPVIPNAVYKVQLEDIKGNVLLGSENVIKTGQPVAFTKEFANFTAKPSDLEFTMVKTPNHPGWGRFDLNAGDYRTDFTIGEYASFLVRFDKLYNAPDEDVTIMFVTRNNDGVIIHSGVQVNTWKKMWPLTYCKLNAPAMPGTVGEYTLDVYFNGMLVHEQPFTVK